MKSIRNLFYWNEVQNSHRLMLLIVFSLGMLNFFWGEKVPAGGGLGWDGVNYASMVRNLDAMLINEELSNYYTQRFLPSAIVRSMMIFTDIKMSDINIIKVFEAYNLSLLLIACFVWKRLAGNFSLSISGRWIGFSGIFINFQCSKQAFYYPVLTDVTALFIAMLLLLFYVEKKAIHLFIATIIGAFCWPVVSVSGAFLLLFLSTKLPEQLIITKKQFGLSYPLLKWSVVKSIFLILLCLFLFACLVFLITIPASTSLCNIFNNILIDVDRVMPNNISSLIQDQLTRKSCVVNQAIPFVVSFFTAIPSIFVTLVALSIMGGSLASFHFIFSEIKRVRLLLWMFAIFAILIPIFVVKILSNPLLPNANGFYAMAWITLIPQLGKVFLPFITLAVFWGPIFILMILFWHDFCIQIRRLGPGVMTVITLTLILGLAGEPRFITLGWPFIVMAIVLLLEKITLTKTFIYLFYGMSIFYAQFWLKINMQPWIGPDFEGLQEFPKQIYFMHYGLWMGWWAYLLQLTALIFSAFLLFRSLNSKS